MQQGFEPVTADQVVDVGFSMTRFRLGYEPDEIDAYLDRCAETLQHHAGAAAVGEAEQLAGPLLAADEIRASRFSSTRLRQGYDQDEVDATLDAIAETLAWYEAR